MSWNCCFFFWGGGALEHKKNFAGFSFREKRRELIARASSLLFLGLAGAPSMLRKSSTFPFEGPQGLTPEIIASGFQGAQDKRSSSQTPAKLKGEVGPGHTNSPLLPAKPCCEYYSKQQEAGESPSEDAMKAEIGPRHSFTSESG